MKLRPGSKIALLPRAGPANGPYTAQFTATFREGLELNDLDVNIAGIYGVSGAGPTALLGCIREEQKLCDIWLNISSKDIVGDKEELDCLLHFLRKFNHLSIAIPHWSDIKEFRKDLRMGLKAIKRLKEGHIFSRMSLTRLIWKHVHLHLDKIFSPEAAIMKIGAVDYLTGQHIIFSNKIPEHKDIIHLGVVASMCIAPLFDSLTIDAPKERKLVERTHPAFDSLLLVDGGYRASLLLEEAIRETVAYDVMIIVDINGVNFRDIDKEMVGKKYNLVTRIEGVQSLASVANDQLQLSLINRINEELSIIEELKKLRKLSNDPAPINKLIERMNNGRLRLYDKHAPETVIASSPEHKINFDFTNCTRAEIARLMQHGHNAALRVLEHFELNIKGLPLVRPV